MVVISAAVCTAAGRPILSRQFVEISRSRIEGLLSAFAKLMNSDKEHTFVETENVRYVYQPLEQLYVLLITNRSSNIMEDLDTLHLFAKLIPEYCQGTDEASVKRNAYDLIFAMDEVIVTGHKEKVTLGQIKTLTEMDSHEERIHEIVERNKQRDAAEQAKIKMKEIEMQKKIKGPSAGYSGGQSYSSSSYTRQEPISIPTQRETKPEVKSGPGRKGMQLGSKTSQSNEYLKQLKDIGEISDEPEILQTSAVPATSAALTQQVKKQSIHVEVEEKLSLILNQDGGVESMELKGELKVEISDPSRARINVILNKDQKKQLQFRTHPNINKALFNQKSILALKDPSKSFPTATSLGILKWRFTGSDSDIPLNVSCWPTPGNEMTVVNLEYELFDKSLELQDVQIFIPLPDGHSPVVENADGSYEHLVKQSILCWKLPLIDKDNENGSMEFTIPYSGSTSNLFPVSIRFSSVTPMSRVKINAIQAVDDNSNQTYSSLINFSPEESGFQIQWS